MSYTSYTQISKAPCHMITPGVATLIPVSNAIDCSISTTEMLGNSNSQTDSVCQHSRLVIPNGVGCFDGNTSGSVISYHCDEGYALSGNVNQTCLSDGNWSGEIPTCKEIGGNR